MEILYEDNHLLVINKQANWIVQGANPDQASLLDWGKDYLKKKYQKPGNVFLGVVSRLDGPVTGAVPFARTTKCASRLSEQIRERSIDKRYWALVEGSPRNNSGVLKHWLSRLESDTVSHVHRREVSGSALAELEYQVLWQGTYQSSGPTSGQSSGRPRPPVAGRAQQNIALLEINLITGRKHQIRAQLQEIGTPILGDRKYGATLGFANGIGLHCRRLQFKHPTQDQMIEIVAPVPDYWPSVSSA